ncbi:MAG TPA: MarC family protein, partial [Chthonomonadales bacterium]|nr:MarC family protein [Chthonomonadales bacterium]
MDDLGTYLKTLITLFVIVDPVGAVAVFLTLTAHHLPADRHSMAWRAAGAATLVLVGSALAGRVVLEVFGIGLASFRVAGGLLLLVMSLDMLNARPSRSRQTPEENQEAEAREDIAVVPMAIPLLAGPGAISTVILLVESKAAGPGFWPLLSMIGIVGLGTAILLRLAAPVGRRLGRTGSNILIRVMGLLLAAIAVEFIAAGAR